MLLARGDVVAVMTARERQSTNCIVDMASGYPDARASGVNHHDSTTICVVLTPFLLRASVENDRVALSFPWLNSPDGKTRFRMARVTLRSLDDTNSSFWRPTRTHPRQVPVASVEACLGEVEISAQDNYFGLRIS